MHLKLDFAKLDIMDTLDLAILIEVEALERYELFAKQLGHTGPDDAGSVFKMMAGFEGKHGQALADRRKAMFGDVPMRVSKSLLFDAEAPDVGSIRWDMSRLQALKVSLSSEEKAYYFYDDAIPFVKDEAIRALFVELRDEETEHMRLLKEILDHLPASAAEELEDLDA